MKAGSSIFSFKFFWNVVVFAVALLFLAEGVLRTFFPVPTLIRLRSKPLHEAVGDAFFRPVRNGHVKEILYRDHVKIYEAEYNMDAFGRRITLPKSTEGCFYSFFGGSFVFGAGVNDGFTLSSALQDNIPSARFFNYGAIAAGPQSILQYVENRDLRKEALGRAGIVFDVLVLKDNWSQASYGDMQKLIGASNIEMSAWQQFLPAYEEVDRTLVYKGSLKESRPLFSMLFYALQQFELLKRLGLSFPPVSDDDYQLLGRILLRTKELLKKQSPRFDVGVIIHPFSGKKSADRAEEILRQMNLPVLRFKALEQMNLEPFKIHGDVHPTAEFNRMFASELRKRLNLLSCGLLSGSFN